MSERVLRCGLTPEVYKQRTTLAGLFSWEENTVEEMEEKTKTKGASADLIHSR